MSKPLTWRAALRCSSAALSLFLASCGASTEFYRGVDDDVSQGNYRQAITRVRENKDEYGDKSSVLFSLDMGLLFHYAGEPDSSTAHLLAAEQEIEKLYTKSISLAAASFLLNDNVLPYDGEDFEKVLVNVFLALNFAQQGEPDEALVEARKVDLKLRELSKQYEGKNRYREDAFIRYIAGVLYETDGEINDAFISYRRAYETYQIYAKEYGTKTPHFLLDDLVRTATLMSFDEEAATYRGLGGKPYVKTGRAPGAILVITYTGKGPVKDEVRPTVSIPDTAGTLHTFQIALPKFLPRFRGPRSYRVFVRPVRDTLAVTHTGTEVAEDVTAIAAKALEDRLTMVYLKSGGRALTKFLAAEKAKSELKKNDDKVVNFLGSLAIDVAVGATERADLRTWRTLPSEFQLARMDLPPGTYDLSVNSSDGGCSVPWQNVTVRSGKTSLFIVDDVR